MELLYKKHGLPEESEIVMCEVTKVYRDSVFVKILEYNISGMIHISEISPGRIRNLADFVKEGKIIICKVLSVNKEKGHVDLSLRRTTEAQKREKSEQIKREQKAEKIIEFVANSLKQDKLKLYEKISSQVLQEYETMHDYFSDVANNPKLIDSLNLDKNVKEKLLDTIKNRIKPPVVELKAIMKIKTYAPNGIDIIKDALKLGDNVENLNIRYVGAGSYSLSFKSHDLKKADRKIEEIKNKIEEFLKKNNAEFEFRKEIKK